MTATTRSAQLTNNSQNKFLNNGGEMGELIAGYNWEDTPLGPISNWPSSLCTTLGIILHSGFPQFFFWGKELICFYNDAFRPSLGVNGKHPAIGKKGKEVWPEIWDFIGPLIEKVMTTGEYVKFEDQLVPFFRNGKVEDIYWTFSYSPAYNDEGEINGVYVTCTETTQKVLNFRQLAESKDQLEFAIEATELGTWDYNPCTGKYIGNHRLKEWLGLSAADDIDLSITLNVIAEKDRERVKEAIRKALDYSSGGQYNVEYTLINSKANTERIVCAKGRAWFNEEKLAYRFNGTLQDITDQKLSEETIRENQAKLKQTQERLKLALSAGALATFIWDIPRDRMFPDENMCKLFNKQYPMEDGMPLNVFVEAIHPDDISNTMAKVKKAIETGCDYRTEYRVKGIDGMYRWVIAAGKIEYAKDGPPNLFSGFLLDITDKKKAEFKLQESQQRLEKTNEELKKNNDQLKKVNDDLDNFIYTASHDLKAPVSNIEGLINTLTQEINEDNFSKTDFMGILKMMNDSIHRFSQTIHDLTTITKIQKDGEEKFFEKVNILALIEDVKVLNKELISNSGARIFLECENCLEINFTKKNLKSILHNLISNAIKYRSPDRLPEIYITTYSNEKYVVLKVKDNGLGLNDSKQKKLFSMFKRFHDHVEGTGIGLYIIKRIIDNAGGKIEVESQEDIGTAFKVYLPVIPN